MVIIETCSGQLFTSKTEVITINTFSGMLISHIGYFLEYKMRMGKSMRVSDVQTRQVQEIPARSIYLLAAFLSI